MRFFLVNVLITLSLISFPFCTIPGIGIEVRLAPMCAREQKLTEVPGVCVSMCESVSTRAGGGESATFAISATTNGECVRTVGLM